MNAFTIDISQHLEDAPKFLKLGPGDENVFKVDDSATTVLKIQDMLNKNGSDETVVKALRIALGDKAVERINAMNLSYKAFQNLFIGVMAAMLGQSFEETEKNFRKTTDK